MRRWLPVLGVIACGDNLAPPASVAPGAGHSSSIAVSNDGTQVYVVNPEVDSVSLLDVSERTVIANVMLGALPAVDLTGAYTPAVQPRALAVSPDGTTLYVTGQRSGTLYAITLATQDARAVAVCSEPIGVAVSGDGGRVYVACSQDDAIVEVAAATLTIVASVAVPSEPWSLAWSPSDGSLLTTHLLGAAVTAIDPTAMTVRATWTIPDGPARGDARLPHGSPRGLYDVAPRPTTNELWIPHLMLGIDTSQPDLDFQSTVFPSLSILRADGTYHATLSIDVADIPGTDGSFADIVSGPHAIAFTADGALALVVDTNSEDVLVVDARGDVEAELLRPLPGHMPEGIAISPDEKFAYVDERNTGDVAVIAIDRTATPMLAVDGAPIARFAVDPMPFAFRLGQHLFYSANSDEYPLTQNHWVACASCHVEGRSDAVTWKFVQGPRDTPTNAGGTLGTGFLFRTADRTAVKDYWRTINIEQGGSFDPVADADLLDVLQQYVDHAIPAPIPPTTDPVLVAAGKAIFERDDVGCAHCHSGPRFTDSGSNNPTLDLTGTVLLHDVGTCVTAGYPDVAHADILGDPRMACRFDTPSLTGVASTPPYLHDGSAPTLHDVLEQTRGKMGNISSLSADDEAALVEYLRSL